MAQHSKQNQIIETAGRLFLQSGFRKVSMDTIAASVPVSKPTLYNHFKSKDALFAAVVAKRCGALLGKIEESIIDENTEPKKALALLGNAFLNTVLTPEALKMHRIIIAECTDFPDMAKLFYESGPKRAHFLLSHYLKRQHQRKKLYVPDPEMSSGIFISMLRGYNYMQFLLGLKKNITPREIKKIIDYAVALFLKAHAL